MPWHNSLSDCVANRRWSDGGVLLAYPAVWKLEIPRARARINCTAFTRGWHVPERSEGRGLRPCHVLRSSGRATQIAQLILAGPKLEIRNKSEGPKDRNPKRRTRVLDLGISDFRFVSDFELRISDFPALSYPAPARASNPVCLHQCNGNYRLSGGSVVPPGIYFQNIDLVLGFMLVWSRLQNLPGDPPCDPFSPRLVLLVVCWD